MMGAGGKSGIEGSGIAHRHGLVELIPQLLRHSSILAESLSIGACNTVGLAANIVI